MLYKKELLMLRGKTERLKKRKAKGGSFTSERQNLGAEHDVLLLQDGIADDVGFRCALRIRDGD
jgi:hypothetical protein